MSEVDVAGARAPDEAVVRGFLTALDSGRFLDALNAFSMDARMRDEAGRERRGIREIAAAFASQAHPVRVEIEDLEKEGREVAVRVRMTFPESRATKTYRSVFRVDRDRIHSLVMNLEPTTRSRRNRLAQSA